MKKLVLLCFLLVTQNAIAQKQKEIKDFKEKWKLDVADMTSFTVNSLAGNLKIIGVEDKELSLKVEGTDVYRLNGGNMELGCMLTKNKNGQYRLQGILDPTALLDVTFTLYLPNSVDLELHFGSRVKDQTSWQIDGMNAAIQLVKNNGDVKLNEVSGPLTLFNQKGSIEIIYSEVDQALPHSIAADGDIILAMPENTNATLDLNLNDDAVIECDFPINGVPRLQLGYNSLGRGLYNYQLNKGGVKIRLHVYGQNHQVKIKN
ncbi:MAG: hypothetical protein AAFO07_04985 [Bacteroidota bacterium]